MALDRLKAKFRSLCIFVILLWITLPEIIHTQGICYKKYVKRSGRCRKKIFEGGRVIHMDFEKCCRRKDAKAWRIKINGIQNCIVCPDIVDGGWSQWTAWSPCPVTCDWGNQTRSRKCDRPIPQHGGKECEGVKDEVRVCYSGRRCPIDGKWGPWSEWLACSKSCNDGGVQFRSRNCDSPRPEFGGRYCIGSSEESRKCNENIECPVHGSWSSWNAWSACSSECTSVRERKCDNPAPNHGGKTCGGLALQKSSCPGYCSKGQGGGSGSGSGSEGSGDGSGNGSGSNGSGDNGIDILVETGQGVVKVNQTKTSKETPTTHGSGEGSGEGGSGSKIDDNEPGDNTEEDVNGKETKNGKENVTQVEVGSGGSGYPDIDVTVEKAPQGEVENKSSKKKIVEGSGAGESDDNTGKDGNGKAKKGGNGNVHQVDGGSGESGYGEIDVTVEKAPQGKVKTKSSKKKGSEGSGDSGSGSRVDDNESGDTTTDDGSGKVDKNDSKNAIQVEGSGEGSGSNVDIIVEKPSENKNNVETKDKTKNSRQDPGWGKKFVEING